MENLTELEKASICFHVFGGCKDRKILFTIAEGEKRANGLKESSLKVTVNNWFNSHKIQEGINFYKAIQEHEKKKAIQDYINSLESETANRTKGSDENRFINLLDRDTFLEEINRGANSAKDEKDKREYLKMISDNLRYKDSERDENNEIQRFYTPVTCENCEIYNKCKSCNIDKCIKM